MKVRPRALVVDDAEFSRNFIRHALEEAGFEVVGEGVDGFEAVELYERLAPDLVVLDVIMPGLDGLCALERIIASNPGARVVMCTSMDDEKTLIRAVKLGARDYVTKPVLKERLVDSARKALEMDSR